ncbi:U-box domain-containing protein 7 [Hordeum vulgare]|nr:U-box domain-containing protein 7 [Hordeum vulgare]
MKVRRWTRVDGYVQDGGIVLRHGGVDGRPSKVDASVPALEMNGWKMAMATSESAPVRYVTQSWYVAGMGNPDLDVRLRCDLCLVFGSDIRHPFIKGIGVATGVA